MLHTIHQILHEGPQRRAVDILLQILEGMRSVDVLNDESTIAGLALVTNILAHEQIHTRSAFGPTRRRIRVRRSLGL